MMTLQRYPHPLSWNTLFNSLKSVIHLLYTLSEMFPSMSSEQHLTKGDAVLIEPGEVFYWQGDQLEMLMPCSPAFYPEQHKEVD